MEPSPVPFDRLYAHRDWVRRVARALVADESRASDLEQQVWLAALEHPPREERSLRGWLGTVLRNAAGKMRRSERRRTLREEAAPPRPAPPGPEEIVAETEAHERVVRAVLALEEPYRSTVLLRYFEDLGPSEVAARLGVPLETVRTRLRRAIEQVRARLDGEHGSRRAWILLLLPLSRPSPRSAAVPVAAAIGGLLMGTALKIAVAGAAVAAGLLLWTRPWEEAPSPAPPVEGAPAAGSSAAPSTAATAAAPAGKGPGATVDAPADAAVEVVDSRGRPVAGAVVRIVDPPGSPADGPSASLPGSTTDSSGKALIAAPRAGRWVVRVEAPGFAPSARNLWLRAGTAEPLRIVLRQGFPLSGSVRDAAGRPVAGAVVAADPNRFGGGGAQASSAASGVDGRFRFEGLRAGLHAITVRTEAGIVHYAGAIRVPGVSNLDLRIRGGVTVRGRVVDDGTGKPLPGVAVTVEIMQGGTPYSGKGTATTGDDGGFAVADLPPGGVGVRIQAQRVGYRTWPPMDARPPAFRGPVAADFVWEKEIRLVAGSDAPAVAAAEPPGSIEGVVVDAAGAPAAGVSIGIWTEAKPFGPPIDIVTEGDGRFRRDGIPAGQGSLYARPSGRGVGGSLAFVLPGGETLRGLRIEMKKGGTIAGRVLRADGRPVAGPALWAARGSFSPRTVESPELVARDDAEAVIAPDGSFRLENLQAGNWILAAGAEECSLAATIQELAEGESKAGIEIVLDAGLEVSGRVLGADGSPVAGALVKGWSDSERTARGALLGVTGGDGVFRGTGFRAGTVHLQVEVDGCRTLERDVSAGDRDVLLIPERATSLAGRVVEKGTGTPLAGVPVRATPEPGSDGRRTARGTWEAVTGKDGTFLIEKVTEGTWTVSAGAGTRGVFTDYIQESLKGVAAGTTGIEIALRHGDRLSGRFVDESGAPYPGVLRIHVHRRLPDGGRESVGAETLSSEDGSFVVGGIEGGSYELTAGASVALGDATPPDVFVKDARTGGEPLVITIPRGVRLRGRVDNLPGPVGGGKGGWILLRVAGEDGLNKTCHLENDGTFRSEPLDPSRTYDLLAREFPGRMGALAGVRPGEAEVVLVLSAGLSLSGRVVDESGEPVGAGVPVLAWARKEGADEPGTRSSTTTRADGTFLLTGLGSFLFGVNAGGGGTEYPTTYAGGGKEEEGIAPGTPDLVLRVRRGLTLKGRLLDAGGKPVAGILVEPIGNGNSQAGIYTGEDGSFVVKGLAPGTVKFRVDDRVLGPFDAAAADLEVRLPTK